MATVYRGRHAALGREVAIKVLHPHLSVSTRNRQRFAREARAIEHLRHPNILEIHDYSGETAEDCYIVTELVDGETLADLLARCRRVPSEVAATIGLSLADALAYAHDAGILHRDLKPENVMLRRDGVVKLMDFGIARFLDESQVTMTGALVGSPAYMSPEQAREEPLDGRSDLFALGTLLFHLVAGELPFGGSNPSVVLKNVIEGNRPALVEVVPSASATLADIVERLLSPAREDRYTTADALRGALMEALSEVGFSPAEPRWALARYVATPEAYEAELDAWLKPTLLERGKASAAKGDHLAALRSLNRLLSMDEGNADALALLEAFHGMPAPDTVRARTIALAAATVLFVVFGALGAWRGGAVPKTLTIDASQRAPAPRVDVVVPIEEGVARIDPPPADGVQPVDVEAATSSTASSPSAPEPAAPRAAADTRSTPRVAESPEPAALLSRPMPVASVVVSDAPLAADARPACVALRSLDAPAEVWLDGVRLRSTRDPGCTQVPPGAHTFLLRGPMIAEKRVTLMLAPGEVRDHEQVALERLPARMRFPSDLRSSCVVLLDNATKGTIADLGGALTIEHPEHPHTIAVRCGDDLSVQSVRSLDYPDNLFDPGPRP